MNDLKLIRLHQTNEYRQEQSCKDDIEGWLYMVIEWTNGFLPWAESGRSKEEVSDMNPYD